MVVSHQKKKLMQGMTKQQATKKFLALWEEKNPGVDFNKQYPKVFPWMEIWFNLRQHNPVFEVVAQAFAEKIKRMRDDMRRIEAKIHGGRLELAKRLKEIDDLKAKLAEK